jgi:8-oxo-dGTP pyrophosphatase MutT (NUDIX family)
MSTEVETSYGGVVLRGDELLVITPAGKQVTGLPKGGMEDGETPEQVAAREVREETGIEATVIEPLGDVRYTYRRGGRRIRKTVHFFRCEYVRGSTADHDHEVDNARWIALSSAREALSYPGERALIERLLSKMPSGR